MTVLRVGVVVAMWCIMIGWLIRFEACPERFTGRFDGYHNLFKSGIVIRSSWMRILANGAQVGYSNTEIDVDDKSPTEHYTINSKMELELNILSIPQSIYTELAVGLDIMSRLQVFTFKLKSKAYSTEISGRRAQGDRFLISIKSGGSVVRQMIDIPDDVILYSPMLEQALGAMDPGQTRVFKTLDPASMAVADVRVRADRRETVTLRGRPEEATVLAAEYQGMTVWTWVNRDGELLRQETPLGWSMEVCDATEAMNYKFAARRSAPDILGAAAVPTDRTLATPRLVRRLELLLKGVDSNPAALETPRQQVLGIETNGIRLRIDARAWPDTAPPSAPPASFWTNDLAATPFIQSADKEIVYRALEITAKLRDKAAAARAVNDWVFKNVRKNPAASLPSAVAVLKQLEGDCNEHTYLAVALLRAVGIPAKVKAGVVYLNDKFYYHAWVAAYVNGEWVEMDPTFGQAVADATHLALAEGELAGQMQLLRYTGRLSIGILGAEEELKP
jgi:transglutaminase-like putative cysteine protease